MKKFGYTLAEVLIAMTIIGVLASLTLPMVNKFKPDSSKAMYIRAYDSIAEILSVLVDNTTIYPVKNTDDGPSYLETPLANTVAVNYDGISIPAGNNKMCYVFAISFNATAPYCARNAAALTNVTNDNYDFITKNGIRFWYTSSVAGKATFLIDVDPKTDSFNCEYNATSCKHPDRFRFNIEPNGSFTVDAKGQEYINDRLNLKRK